QRPRLGQHDPLVGHEVGVHDVVGVPPPRHLPRGRGDPATAHHTRHTGSVGGHPKLPRNSATLPRASWRNPPTLPSTWPTSWAATAGSRQIASTVKPAASSSTGCSFLFIALLHLLRWP